MTIFAKKIKLSELLSVTVLSNRATARTLIDEIKKLNYNKVKLDFKNIEFVSRSFMDELISKMNELENTRIKIKNMNDQVSKMKDLVQDQSIRNSWHSDTELRKDSELITM